MSTDFTATSEVMDQALSDRKKAVSDALEAQTGEMPYQDAHGSTTFGTEAEKPRASPSEYETLILRVVDSLLRTLATTSDTDKARQRYYELKVEMAEREQKHMEKQQEYQTKMLRIAEMYVDMKRHQAGTFNR